MQRSDHKTYGGMKQVLAVSAGLFLVFLDTTIVNIAMPDITQDLRIELSTASWVINAFVLTVAVLFVTLGKLADMIGGYRTYMFGLLIFMAASLLCGLANSASSLILFRVLQGIGAATVIPASMMLVRTAVPQEKVGTAMGIWGGVGALAIALGPSLGGIITEFLNWKWIFFINLPVIIIAFPLTMLVFRNHTDQRIPFRIDILGVITLGTCLFFLTYAILMGQEAGWWSDRIILFFFLSFVSGVLFLFIQRRVKFPLVELKLFSNRVFIAGFIANFLSGVLLLGTLIILPIYFTQVKGLDILWSSIMITPLSAIMLIVAPLIGRWIDKVRYFYPMSTGYMFAVIGFYLLSKLQADYSNGYLILIMGIAGTGIGILMVTSVTIGTASVPVKDASMGSALYATARNMGGTVGVALFVSIMLSGSVGISTGIDDLVHGISRAFVSGLVLSILLSCTLPLLWDRNR